MSSNVRGSRVAEPTRPELPEDEEPQLPRRIVREIERIVGKGRKSHEVALALSIGSAAIDEERSDIALPYLAWAKHMVPRVAAVREAYGVALYLEGEFAEALTELQAFRRMTGTTEQNHLIADIHRALGRELDRVATVAAELVDDVQAPAERRVEAAIVWASALADHGQLHAARAMLRKFAKSAELSDETARRRLLYVTGDLADRDGSRADAVEAFEMLASIDPGYLDVVERLEGLRG